MTSALIVNYRTKELTAQAIQSCLLEPEIEEVVVVDNASGDDSVAWLKKEFEAQPVIIIAGDENAGFGRGNNIAAQNAGGDTLLLINSDAYLLPGAAAAMLKRLEDKTVGAVGPLVLNQDEKTEQKDNYGAFPTAKTIFTRSNENTNAEEPDWISGVCILFPKAVYEKLGGFDERFFMYLEDVDLCYRLRKMGYRIVREPNATIVHLGGQSKSSSLNRKRQYYKSQDLILAETGVGIGARIAIKLLRWPIYFLKAIIRR